MLLYYPGQQCMTSGHLCKLPCTSIHYRFHLATHLWCYSTGTLFYAVQHSYLIYSCFTYPCITENYISLNIKYDIYFCPCGKVCHRHYAFIKNCGIKMSPMRAGGKRVKIFSIKNFQAIQYSFRFAINNINYSLVTLRVNTKGKQLYRALQIMLA